MWSLSSLTRDEIHTPCIGRQSLNHRTTVGSSPSLALGGDICLARCGQGKNFCPGACKQGEEKKVWGRGSRTGCLGVCVQGSMKIHERVSRQDKVRWGEKGQVAADLLGFFQSLWEWSERQVMVKAFWTLEPGLLVFALIWIYFTSLVSLYLCIIKSISEGKWPPSDKHKNLKSRARDLHSHINIQCVCLLAIVLLGTVLLVLVVQQNVEYVLLNSTSLWVWVVQNLTLLALKCTWASFLEGLEYTSGYWHTQGKPHGYFSHM